MSKLKSFTSPCILFVPIVVSMLCSRVHFQAPVIFFISEHTREGNSRTLGVPIAKYKLNFVFDFKARSKG